MIYESASRCRHRCATLQGLWCPTLITIFLPPSLVCVLWVEKPRPTQQAPAWSYCRALRAWVGPACYPYHQWIPFIIKNESWMMKAKCANCERREGTAKSVTQSAKFVWTNRLFVELMWVKEILISLAEVIADHPVNLMKTNNSRKANGHHLIRIFWVILFSFVLGWSLRIGNVSAWISIIDMFGLKTEMSQPRQVCKWLVIEIEFRFPDWQTVSCRKTVGQDGVTPELVKIKKHIEMMIKKCGEHYAVASQGRTSDALSRPWGSVLSQPKKSNGFSNKTTKET